MAQPIELLIMSAEEAGNHIPHKGTYAIRIHSGHPMMKTSFRNPLKESTNWLHVAEYEFDDVYPRSSMLEHGYVLFTGEIAKQIVNDFKKYKKDTESLLVNCARGINRSPAVAVALNDIFNLGHDRTSLMQKYPDLNSHVLDTMLDVGKTIVKKK